MHQAIRIPPKLEQPKTTAGLPIGPRELVIVGPALAIGLLLFFSSAPFFLKVGGAVGLVGLTAALALIRIEKRLTIEKYLLQRMGYLSRVRRRVKGGAGQVTAGSRSERTPMHRKRRRPAKPRTVWLTLAEERVPENRVMLANALGLALLVALLAWLGTDGVQDLLRLRANVQYLR